MTFSFLNMNHRDAIWKERQHEKMPWSIITAPKGATFLNITDVNKQKTFVKDLMPRSQKEIRYFKRDQVSIHRVRVGTVRNLKKMSKIHRVILKS